MSIKIHTENFQVWGTIWDQYFTNIVHSTTPESLQISRVGLYDSLEMAIYTVENAITSQGFGQYETGFE